MKESKIVLGTWSWGSGAFGGDSVFGNKTDEVTLRPVFETALKAGLNIWDTATVYGMGESERILGSFIRDYKREDIMRTLLKRWQRLLLTEWAWITLISIGFITQWMLNAGHQNCFHY